MGLGLLLFFFFLLSVSCPPGGKDLSRSSEATQVEGLGILHFVYAGLIQTRDTGKGAKPAEPTCPYPFKAWFSLSPNLAGAFSNKTSQQVLILRVFNRTRKRGHQNSMDQYGCSATVLWTMSQPVVLDTVMCAADVQLVFRYADSTQSLTKRATVTDPK